jgi:hypothetical protein
MNAVVRASYMQAFLATSLVRVAEALSKVLYERDTTLYWPAGGLSGPALSQGWQKPLFQRTTDQLACAWFDATTQINAALKIRVKFFINISSFSVGSMLPRPSQSVWQLNGK